MIQFADCYRGSRVLITGHTGFKGSWLALWLEKRGAEVSGISLDPETEPNHRDQLNLSVDDNRLDIRNFELVSAAVREFRPQIVFHLAAQPSLRRSYRDPIDNWSTNVMGTAHVLEDCRHVESVEAIVAITTDKVYRRSFLNSDDSPYATRPWQHVLGCLVGYMQLGQRLLEGRREFADAWNFGSQPEANRTVKEVLTALQTHWPDLKWEQTATAEQLMTYVADAHPAGVPWVSE